MSDPSGFNSIKVMIGCEQTVQGHTHHKSHTFGVKPLLSDTHTDQTKVEPTHFNNSIINQHVCLQFSQMTNLFLDPQ